MNKIEPPIRAIIFDLGDTLMVPIGSWPNVFQAGAVALESWLCENSYLPQNSQFHALFLNSLQLYYSNRESSRRELGTFEMLRSLLSRTALVSVPDAHVKKALDEFYKITRKNWQADPLALPTLKRLQEAGFELGMISNAGNRDDVQKLVKKFGFSPYLRFIITSYDVGYRKPDPRIFAAVDSRWQIAARQTLMVGDRTDTDILGGKAAGMRTAWINRHQAKNKLARAHPDLEISSLDELIRLAPPSS